MMKLLAKVKVGKTVIIELYKVTNKFFFKITNWHIISQSREFTTQIREI